MSRRLPFLLAGLGLLLLYPHSTAAQGDKASDPAGQWVMTVETPAGNFTSTLKLTRTGDQLTGVSISGEGKETKLNDVKLVGNTLTFTEDISYEGADYHLAYTGTVEGDSLKGTFETNGQTMSWSAKRAVSSSTSPGGAAGTWRITVQTPNGARERTLILKQEGDKLTGTITGPMDRVIPLDAVSLQGKELHFTLSFDRNGETVKRIYTAMLDGDSLSGKVEGGDQSITFTGKRQPDLADPATPTAAPSLAGTWKLAVQAPDRTYRPTVTLAQEGGKWNGKLVDEQGDVAPLMEIAIKENQLAFTADLDTGGMVIHLQFSGKLEGGQLKGTMTANNNALPTTGDRQKGG